MKLEDLDIDLSDWSDEFVAGFVAGADHALNAVGSDGEPLIERLSPRLAALLSRLEKYEAVVEAARGVRGANETWLGRYDEVAEIELAAALNTLHRALSALQEGG